MVTVNKFHGLQFALITNRLFETFGSDRQHSINVWDEEGWELKREEESWSVWLLLHKYEMIKT
jgi:hypothetical protein